MATRLYDEKVLRLLAEGKVQPDIAPDPQLFHVEGDHGNYAVVVGAHVAMCSCPATGRCTHIEAAIVRANATVGELALMDAAVERRREQVRAEGERIFARLERGAA